jgi:hypothetical protein
MKKELKRDRPAFETNDTRHWPTIPELVIEEGLMIGIGHFHSRVHLLLACNSGASSPRLALLVGLVCSAVVVLARVAAAALE